MANFIRRFGGQADILVYLWFLTFFVLRPITAT